MRNIDLETMLQYLPLADVARVAAYGCDPAPQTERSPTTGEEPTIPAPRREEY